VYPKTITHSSSWETLSLRPPLIWISDLAISLVGASMRNPQHCCCCCTTPDTGDTLPLSTTVTVVIIHWRPPIGTDPWDLILLGTLKPRSQWIRRSWWLVGCFNVSISQTERPTCLHYSGSHALMEWKIRGHALFTISSTSENKLIIKPITSRRPS